MDLSKIISISGKSGLFEVVGNSKSSLIVSSLSDGKRMPVMATHRISSLDEISIYTEDADLPLIEVLIKLRDHEKGEPTMNPKSDGKQLFAHFEKIIPDFDQERVYASDIKKLFNWYNLLQVADKVKDLKLESEEGDASAPEPATEEKAAPKKDAADKE